MDELLLLREEEGDLFYAQTWQQLELG